MQPQAILCLTVLAIAQARVVDKGCDGIVVHNIFHEKEVLKTGLDSPYQLALDYDSNTLFCSYSTKDDSHGFRAASLNLKTNVFSDIKGIPGGFASTIDRRSNIVYLGGNDGIYTYDFGSKSAKFFGDRNTNIWAMFFKDRLYYTNFPDEKAFVFYNGMSHELPELRSTKVMFLAVDNNDNLIFSNSSGLFWYKKAKANAYFLGEYSVNGITSDINGNLYFSTATGIFSISANGDVQRLTTMENVYGVAIEGDNSIIYSDEESIVRLKPTKTLCIPDEKKPLLHSVDNTF